MSAFLEVKDVSKYYGAIRAVDGVSFKLGPGEIVGVIGPERQRQDDAVQRILGQIRPTSGAVEFAGEDITGMSPLELARRGIGRTFQTLQVFGKLSVRDNLIVAAQEFKGTMKGRLFAAPDAGLGEHADEMIELFRLQHVGDAARRHAVVRPAEADRHRDGVHGGAAAGAARRALRRASTPASSTSCASCWSSSTRRRAAASSSSSTTWTS